MNKKRERFFLGMSNISAWNFAEVNILTMLYLLKGKRELHGRAIQSTLLKLFHDNYSIGNDLLYKVLNSMEKQKYVKSSWKNDTDINKRYIRNYWITDLGIKRLNSLKTTYGHNLNNTKEIMMICLHTIWGDDHPQSFREGKYLFSSKLFSKINVLSLLNNSQYKGISAKELQTKLYENYNDLWKPSDGVIYPLLSELDTKGYINSSWSIEDEDLKKKRTTRNYSINKKGEDLYKKLISPNSGVKNKLIQINDMCDISYEFVYGNTIKNTQIIMDYSA